ncbi:hypothetical protein ElyMa_002588500 [Elysia marginata]|uniref:THD domain-containing protein n=1 Tax=Elysia marginata TaxID=1093978 RepID=A0AAV4H3Z9_9GAST|nr:hypothetical protein ElyMa_002588500 [Elysia marginata]
MALNEKTHRRHLSDDPVSGDDSANDRIVYHQRGGVDSNAHQSSVVLLASVSLVLIVGMMMLAVILTPPDSLRQTRSHACVPCASLPEAFLANATNSTIQRRQLADGEECCIKTSTLLSLVLRLQQTLASNSITQYKTLSSPAFAHKRFYRGLMSPKKASKIDPLITFTNMVGCRFLPNDTRYEEIEIESHQKVHIADGGVQIIYGGLYYVYLTILIKPRTMRPCKLLESQPFTAYLERRVLAGKNPNLRWSRRVLEIKQTCCASCVDPLESRHTSGLFVLKPGDEIGVTILSHSLVDFTVDGSTLGLVKLGEIDA